MILYNLTIKIDEAIKNDWLSWIQEVFIPMAMETDTFTEHRLCRLLELEDPDGETYALQLFCHNTEELEAFRQKEELALQSALVHRFPDQLVFFPTAMEVL